MLKVNRKNSLDIEIQQKKWNDAHLNEYLNSKIGIMINGFLSYSPRTYEEEVLRINKERKFGFYCI